MKDPYLIIRQQYFSKLDGLVVGSLGAIPLYDVVPETDNELTTNYMKIGRQTYSQVSPDSRSNFGGLATVEVEIYQRFIRGGLGGRENIDLISNAVELQIADSVQNYIDLSPSFKCVVTTLLSSQDLPDVGPTSEVVQRILTFQHNIYQLN